MQASQQTYEDAQYQSSDPIGPQTQEWRLRDERMDWNHPDALRFTQNYVGDLVAEWHMADSIAHIYHNGYSIIDKDDVAHLYE